MHSGCYLTIMRMCCEGCSDAFSRDTTHSSNLTPIPQQPPPPATAANRNPEYCVAVSREHSQIYSWGWGDFGRLGHGHASDCFVPHPVSALSGVAIKQVACGDAHTLVVTDAGALFTFGRNQNGAAGSGGDG